MTSAAASVAPARASWCWPAGGWLASRAAVSPTAAASVPDGSGPTCSSQGLDDDGLAAVRLQLRSGREDPPVPHPDDPPRRGGHPRVMGDEHDRLAAVVQSAQQFDDLFPAFGVEGAGR